MRKYMVVGDTRIKINDKLKINQRGQDNGIGPVGTTVTVCTFTEDPIRIELLANKAIDGWSDLHGKVKKRHGLSASRDCIIDNFDFVSLDFEIAETFEYKKKNLRGMKARLLHQSAYSNDCFVELDQDVSGGSADGMGKKGHCVVVPASVLKRKGSNERLKEIKARRRPEPGLVDVGFIVAQPEETWPDDIPDDAPEWIMEDPGHKKFGGYASESDSELKINTDGTAALRITTKPSTSDNTSTEFSSGTIVIGNQSDDDEHVMKASEYQGYMASKFGEGGENNG